MLRIHLLQQWYSLSDPAMEEALIEVPTRRRSAGIDLISDRIRDETTILTFRHLREKHAVVTTFANVHDLTPVAELLHGDEEVIYADAGYQGIDKRSEMAGKSTTLRVAMRPGPRHGQKPPQGNALAALTNLFLTRKSCLWCHQQ